VASQNSGAIFGGECQASVDIRASPNHVSGLRRLAGKHVLVTGTACDLRREIAQMFVFEGATAFVSDIDGAAASLGAPQIGVALGFAHGVTNESDWETDFGRRRG
jgi:hypothetical protein